MRATVGIRAFGTMTTRLVVVPTRWRFIDSVAVPIAKPARGEAPTAGDAKRAHAPVFAALGA